MNDSNNGYYIVVSLAVQSVYYNLTLGHNTVNQESEVKEFGVCPSNK